MIIIGGGGEALSAEQKPGASISEWMARFFLACVGKEKAKKWSFIHLLAAI